MFITNFSSLFISQVLFSWCNLRRKWHQVVLFIHFTIPVSRCWSSSFESPPDGSTANNYSTTLLVRLRPFIVLSPQLPVPNLDLAPSRLLYLLFFSVGSVRGTEVWYLRFNCTVLIKTQLCKAVQSYCWFLLHFKLN